MNWFKSLWKSLNTPVPPKVRISVDTRTVSQIAINFTPRAQQVLALARKEADRFNHNFVGTEHLLLGLTSLGQGTAVIVLAKMGLDLETVRIEVEKQVGTGPDQKMIGNIPYTPRVKKVFALASKEAKALNHTYVGTEHILLGLLREGDGVAARVLKNLDVDIEKTRQAILEELDPNYAASSSPPKPPEMRVPVDVRMASQIATNFTPRAQQVLALARKEADRFNHNFVGTEHLLLGLTSLGQGTAVIVLAKMGIDLETVRLEVEKQVGTGPERQIPGNIPYTPRVKKVLALASNEAKALSHTYVGTEHILLGLLREGDGVAGRVLKNLDVDIEKTRQAILKELDPNYAAPSSSPKPPEPRWKRSQIETIDTSKRYDVYCREPDSEVVYRNVVIKGKLRLTGSDKSSPDTEFLKLEQSNGQAVYVPVMIVTKFCETGGNLTGENLPPK